MKVVFISNYFNHHQKEFCDCLYSVLDNEFAFIATTSMRQERIQLGYELDEIPDYVFEYSKSKDEMEKCQSMIDDADIVLFGMASIHLIKNRIKYNKIVIRYSERVNKNNSELLKYLPRLFIWNFRYPFWKPIYVFAASGYAAYDYKLFGMFRNKMYKWGYFPQTKCYNEIILQNNKDRKKILWCGRFINWKHPEDVIFVAEKLKSEGYDFTIDFIGIGAMEMELKQMILNKELENNVQIVGSMKHEQVRNQMEKAGIFLATSDFNEGWGAVLNESMNSGCAVIASHAIGAVPFLIRHQENGLVYENGNINDLYNKLKYLLENPEQQRRLGVDSYHTIVDLWNAEVAAKRFLEFTKEIIAHGYCDLYKDGPCSKAEIIKNNWFKG